MTPGGPRATGASPAMLTELLLEFEETVAHAGAPIREALRRGLSRDEVQSKLASVGLQANEEIVSWFAWRNGPREELHLAAYKVLPTFSIASLENAIVSYQKLVLEWDSPILPSPKPPYEPDWYQGIIRPGWLLLSEENWGFAARCDGDPSEPPLVRQGTDDPFDPYFEGKLQAVSLCTLVTWWIEGIANGAYVWDAAAKEWGDVIVKLLPQSQQDACFF